jgi:hypothetical protein
MKRITLVLILIIVISSCGNDSKKADSSAVNNTQIEQTENESSINQEDLKELLLQKTPFTEADFMEAFPKAIKDLALDNEVQIINQQGYATYGNKKITLTIYDCAGKHYGKATLFGTVYNIKAQDIDDTKYSNITRDAIKTINTHRANRNQSGITLLHKNRWYVVLTGNNMNPDELWDAFELNALKKFK